MFNLIKMNTRKKIISFILFICGSVLLGLSVIAPHIGLGEKESFIFFQIYGFTRSDIFKGGGILVAIGLFLYAIDFFLNVLFRLFGWMSAKTIQTFKTSLSHAFAKADSNRQNKRVDIPPPSVLVVSTFLIGATLASILTAFVSFEIYHRIKLIDRIEERIAGSFLWIHGFSLHENQILDNYLETFSTVPDHGQFRANSKFDLSIAHETKGTVNFSVKTNPQGLLSDHEYVTKRDSNKPEYRIAVLGDSFTGPTTSTYQWVDTIEELLNSSISLKDAVGGKEFKVYNFGWIGAGFQTFWKEYDQSARHYDPDLVLLNYIEWDFPRTDGHHLSTDQDMVAHANGFLNRLFSEHKNILVTLMPNYNDMTENERDEMSDYRRTEMLSEKNPYFAPVIMRDLMPTHLGKEEILSWFNIPHDAHYSDRGGEIYARKIASLISEKLTGRTIDFSQVKTRYSDIVLGPDKPKTRPLENSLAFLANSGERIRYLKNYVKEKMLNAKVFSFYPYSWKILTGKGTDGIESASNQAHAYSIIDVPYGPNEGEFVKMNIICVLNDAPPDSTNPMWSLDNPECKHYFHIYAKERSTQ